MTDIPDQNFLSWDEFERVEIRVGTIIEVNPFPDARNPSFKLRLDFGDYGILESSAQITKYYSLDSLLGSQIVAVVNFGVKRIAGFESQCLVLGVVEPDRGVVLLRPDREVANGLRIA